MIAILSIFRGAKSIHILSDAGQTQIMSLLDWANNKLAL